MAALLKSDFTPDKLRALAPAALPDLAAEIRRLIIDTIPLTFGIVSQGAYQLLFGTWMCVFGLVNLSARRVLSRSICWLGAYYIVCGTVCLAAAGWLPFTSPWPMGAVFFLGELAGSRIFAAQQRQEADEAEA